jgi:hypothetical protein
MSTFTPPSVTIRPDQFIWATYIGDRWPRFKVHRIASHAHSAITYRFGWGRPEGYIGNNKASARALTDIKLYRLIDQVWVEEMAWDRGTIVTHLPWQEEPIPTELALKKRRVEKLNATLRNFRREVEDLNVGEDAEDTLAIEDVLDDVEETLRRLIK